MKKIILHNGMTTMVDDEDYEYLNKFHWLAHKEKNNYYAYRCSNGGKIAMHREIMNMEDGDITDHVDRDTLNNQKYNLRKTTTSYNDHNCKPYGVSRFRGVTVKVFNTKTKGIVVKFRAEITKDKVRYNCGLYNTEIDAALAYNNMAARIYGEYASINIIK